jgi:WD40 repeat protein
VRQETLVGVLQQGKVIKWRLSSSGEKYKTVGGKHKFVLEGLADRVSASPTCISCKVIDEQNIYAAVGNEVGSLQLINLHTGRVVREFTIHQLPLLGFSWVDANLLYAFSHSSPTKEKFKNIVSCVDLQTGRVYFIRLRKTLESGALRDMKVSFNGGHALLLVGERLEIWELGSAPALLKSTPNAVEVTATTWCMTEAIALHKLRFAAASKGGSIHLFTLEDKIISSDHVFVQSSPPVVVTSLCWKDNYIVSGNATGDLRMYEVGKELPVNLSREVSSEQPVLLKLEFSPIPSLYKLYALYVNRFELWDLSTSSKLSKANKLLKNNREEALGIKDITWANAFLVVLFSNGCIRISDQKLKKSACSMRHSPVPNFWCPSLYNKQVQAYIKSALYTLPGGLSAERSSATTEQMALSTCDYQLSRALVKLIKKVYGEALSSCTSYEECFQLVSEIFGEPFEHAFWSLARLHIPQVLETSRDSAGQTADMSFPCSPLRPFHGIYEDQYGVRKSIESRCGARALASLPQVVI